VTDDLHRRAKVWLWCNGKWRNGGGAGRAHARAQW
jgi:hypothetical protein